MQKKIALNYTTNLSVNRKFIDRWIPLLNQLGKVHLGVSVDSYGKFNDLIRQGSDFDLIDKNLRRIYQTKAQNISVVIDVTMTSILFFNLIEFSRWIIENQHQTHFKMMIGFGQAGIFLRVESLKLEFRKQKIQEWQQWCETLSPSELSLLKNLKEMLSTHCLAPEFSSAYKLVNDEHREKIQSYNFMEMEDFLSSEMKDASIF